MAWSCAGSQQAQGHVSQVDLGVKPQPLATGQVVLPGMLARNNQNSSLRIFIEYLLGTRHCSVSLLGHRGDRSIQVRRGGLVQNQGNDCPLFLQPCVGRFLFTGCHHTAAVPALGPPAEIPSPSGSAGRACVRRKSGGGHALWAGSCGSASMGGVCGRWCADTTMRLPPRPVLSRLLPSSSRPRGSPVGRHASTSAAWLRPPCWQLGGRRVDASIAALTQRSPVSCPLPVPRSRRHQ